MTNYTQYRDSSESTTQAQFPSTIIWADCPMVELMHDPGKGHHHFDDFRGYTETATGVGNSSGLPVFEGNCTMTQEASGSNGSALAILCTTNNEEAALQCGQTGVMSISPDNGGKLWFECRIKKSSITEGNVFVGLAQGGAGVADFINDAGTDFSDVSLIGFNQFEADEDAFDFCYQNSGQAFQTVLGDAATVTAGTYVKLGFVFDPNAPAAEKIKIYVDGVEKTTFVTEANMQAATFPSGDTMSPLIAIKADSANDLTVSLDWWRAAYVR